jgi:hypothetical protein
MENLNRTSLTNREVIASFREWIGDTSGLIGQSNPMSQRLLLRHLLYYRAPLLAAKVNSGDNSYRKARQTTQCMSLEKVDMAMCPCAPLSGCEWLRTKLRIPDTIGEVISVTSIDGDIDYDYRNWDDVRNKFNSRHAAIRESATFTERDGYIYLHNDIHKKAVRVTSLFSDPRQVQLMADCDDKQDTCISPLDLEFPFDPEQYPVLFQTVSQALLQLKGATRADVNNNDLDG